MLPDLRVERYRSYRRNPNLRNTDRRNVEFFGELTAAPRPNGITVKLVTRSRVIRAGQSSTVWREGPLMGTRKVESDLIVKPDEVIALALPRLSENESAAFANRQYLIRIRARQVR